VSQSVTVGNCSLKSQFLGGLMYEPCIAELSLNVFAIEQMSKDKLIFGEGFLGENDIKGPSDFVIESKGLYSFDVLKGSKNIFLAGNTSKHASTISFISIYILNSKELFMDGEVVYFTSEIIFEGIIVSAGSSDTHI